MRNSSLVALSGRTFLVKVDAAVSPGGIGVPVEPSQWESGSFRTAPPRKEITWQNRRLSHDQTRDPQPGDRLYIWINKDGGGRGLSAVAEVGIVSPVDSPQRKLRRSIQSLNVVLYRPLGVLNDTHLVGARDNVFEDIRRSRTATLRYISDDEAEEIEAAVRQRSNDRIRPA